LERNPPLNKRKRVTNVSKPAEKDKMRSPSTHVGWSRRRG
jgi:hypothetical protein